MVDPSPIQHLGGHVGEIGFQPGPQALLLVEKCHKAFGLRDDAGQEYRLGQGQAGDILVEIEARRLLGAEDMRPPFDDVQVDLKHALLADQPVFLDQPGDDHLLQLAGDGFLPLEEEVFDQLHGDRAGAAHEALVPQVGGDGILDGFKQKAPMSEKSAVLRDHDGVFQIRRDLLEAAEIRVFRPDHERPQRPVFFINRMEKRRVDGSEVDAAEADDPEIPLFQA